MDHDKNKVHCNQKTRTDIDYALWRYNKIYQKAKDSGFNYPKWAYFLSVTSNSDVYG